MRTRGRVGRTARALGVQWRAELTAAAGYRTDLLTGLVVSSFWLVFAIAPVVVLFQHVDVTEGWTLGSLLLVQAIWFGLDAFLWLFLIPNLSQLSERVRSGELDMLLLRPVDSVTMATVGRLHIHDVPKLVIAIVVGVVTVVAGDLEVTPLRLVSGLVAVASACLLMWALGVLVHAKALTSVRFDAGFGLHSIHNLARVPTPLYGPTARLVLTVVVPVAFLTTVPAELLTGRTSHVMALVSLAVAVVAAALARAAWSHQVRRYTGAMA